MMFTRSMTSASNSSRGSSRSSTASAAACTSNVVEEDYDYDDPTDEDWVPRNPVTVDGPLRRSARLNGGSGATGSVTRHYESNTTQQHRYNTRNNKRY